VKEFHPFDYDYAFGGSAGAVIDGEAVFVLVASYVNRGAAQLEDGIAIIASRDGKNWSIVHDVPDDDYPKGDIEFRYPLYKTRNFIGVVYDAPEPRPGVPASRGTFYAVALTILQYWPGQHGTSPEDTQIGNTLYTSSDGFSWSEVGEELFPSATPAEAPPLNTPSMIEPHCNKPNNDGHIPDGLQGYSYGIDTFIKPDGLTDFNLYGTKFDPGPPSRVEIKAGVQGGIAGGVAPGPENEKVSMPCYAVALAGSAFMAVGGTVGPGPGHEENTAVIDVAMAPANPAGPDGTWKWKTVYKKTGKGPIATVVGLPRSAVKVKIKSDVSGGQGGTPPSTQVP
jgi:hypothetical protein